MANEARSARRFVWPLLCLFQLSLTLGWFLLRPAPRHSDTDSEPATSVPVKPAPLPRADPPLSATDVAREIARGDELVRQGRYDLALSIYVALPESSDASLSLRRAVSHEGLGQWDRALAEYRMSLGRAFKLEARLAAEVGQARVWIRRGQPQEARALLYRLLLAADRPHLRDHATILEAHYLLAIALAHEAAPLGTGNPLSDEPVRVLPTDWGLSRSLTEPAALAEGKRRAVPLQVKRQGNKAEEFMVQGEPEVLGVSVLIDRLAEGAGLQSRWSDAARNLVAERSLEIAVANRTLRDVLTAVCGALGLAWEVKENNLQLVSDDVLAPADRSRYRGSAARLGLRAALVVAPAHPLALTGYLELGALESADGKLAEAAAWYERAGRDLPRDGQAIVAQYNLGVLLRKLGKDPQARTAFYRAIDHSPRHELAAAAYLRIGQMYLDVGNYQQALQPLRQAIKGSLGGAYEPAAVVHLAAAHLLAGDPHSANATLRAHREPAGRPPLRNTAAFLDALSRFRTTRPSRTATEGGDLLSALLALPEESLLGTPGMLLHGQAYRDMGMADKMAEVYRRALKKNRGALLDEMSFALAHQLYSNGARSEALAMFQELAKKEKGRWGRAAKLSLAEISFNDKRTAECLATCRGLLVEQGPDLRDVLKLMGRAFEATGDYQRAARCFAGELPE